jgi:hypothetical protein
MIAFTLDIDWAHEDVINDTLSFFETYGIKCTFFSTHHSPRLINATKKLFEIGIHPNFNPVLSGKSAKTPADIIDELLDVHPDAKGVRSHSMTQNTDLLNLFIEKGLIYDANIFLPYQTGLKPFTAWNGLIRIPFNWEDDVHLAYGQTFESWNVNLLDDGLVVFAFHPVHIYLNTENRFRYNEAKKYNNEPDKLISYRNCEIKGTRDLLISLMEYINHNKLEVKTLLEIANQFKYTGKI